MSIARASTDGAHLRPPANASPLELLSLPGEGGSVLPALLVSLSVSVTLPSFCPSPPIVFTQIITAKSEPMVYAEVSKSLSLLSTTKPHHKVTSHNQPHEIYCGEQNGGCLRGAGFYRVFGASAVR